MSRADLVSMTPLLVLAATALAAVVAVAIRRHHRTVLAITLAGLATVCVTLPMASTGAPPTLTPLLVIDRFAVVYLGLVALATAAVAALSYGYLDRGDEDPEEFYLLLLLAAVGSAVLVTSRHFASLFVGLETLSVSLYGLIGYRRSSQRAVEAGLKYLVLAATSSALLLFGGALTYAAAGTLELTGLAGWEAGPHGGVGWLAVGAALVLVGLGFKLAVVPFHMWTPDVYEGAPAPTAGFVATVSKGAVLALAVRLVLVLHVRDSHVLTTIVATIAVASMFVGNLLALLQPNLKRLLAYSSIAHMGYALVALLVSGPMAAEAVTFYLISYVITILTAFGVVAVRSGPHGDCDLIEDYRGLFWTRPWLAALLTTALVSLAGLPLTAGFMGKYVLVAAGVSAGLWLPVWSLVAASVLSLYYYLRVVVTMAASPVDARAQTPERSWSAVGGLALALLMALILGVGVIPSGVMRVAASAAASVTSDQNLESGPLAGAPSAANGNPAMDRVPAGRRQGDARENAHR